MNTALVVFIVDSAGEAVELGPSTKHRLHCEGVQCVFPGCPCAPKDRHTQLHSPVEPRIAKQQPR